jgi:hypothetical protein
MSDWVAETGSVVVLERADGAWPGLTATVVGHHDGHAVVELGMDVVGELEADVDMVVLAPRPDCMWRQRAHARRRGNRLELFPQGEVERLQRRLLPRRRVELPVTLANLDGDDAQVQAVRGTTVDLGPGGARVRTVESLPAGCDPTLVVTLPTGERVVSLTSVLEAGPCPGGTEYRLVFTELADDVKYAISRWAQSS